MTDTNICFVYSHYFGWTGPGLTIDTACSASAVAVHQACKAILGGECTGALVGGVALMGNILWFQNLAGASFLSPTGQVRTLHSLQIISFDDGLSSSCSSSYMQNTISHS